MIDMNKEKISRADFLKKGLFAALGVAIAAKTAVVPTEAATVRDNLGGSGGGTAIGTTPPSNKSKLWIDTSTSGRGVLKYWNGSVWQSTASVWDE